jgi:hypothetical protein
MRGSAVAEATGSESGGQDQACQICDPLPRDQVRGNYGPPTGQNLRSTHHDVTAKQI